MPDFSAYEKSSLERQDEQTGQTVITKLYEFPQTAMPGITPHFRIAVDGTYQMCPGYYGEWAPRLEESDTIAQVPDRATWSQVRAIYKTPPLPTLDVEMAGENVPLLFEQTGAERQVQGHVGVVGGIAYSWKVIAGRPFRLSKEATVVLTTYHWLWNAQAVWARQWYTNSGTMTNFGNAPPDTMLFLGCKVRTHFRPGFRFDVSWLFMFNPATWAQGVTVKGYKQIAEKVQRFENDVAVPDEFSTMLVSVPDSDPVEYRNPSLGQTDFSDLDVMLAGRSGIWGVIPMPWQIGFLP